MDIAEEDGFTGVRNRLVTFQNQLIRRLLDGDASKIDCELLSLAAKLTSLTHDKNCSLNLVQDCKNIFGLRGDELRVNLRNLLKTYRDQLICIYNLKDEKIPEASWVTPYSLDIRWNGDTSPLENAIREHKLESIWGDSFQPISESESIQRIARRREESIATFTRMMSSKNNDGSCSYLEWAVKKTLGLRTSRGYTAQAIGGKHWRSWGKN